MAIEFKPLCFLFNSIVNGGNYLPKKAQYILLIFSQIQMIFLSIECLLAQSSSDNHDFKYVSTEISNGLTFYGTNDIDFICAIIGLFLLLTIFITIRVAVSIYFNNDKRGCFWIKLMNTIHQIHFHIFWLPAFVISLGLIKNYEGNNKLGVKVCAVIASILNFLLVGLNLIYRSLSSKDNKLFTISDYFLIIRRIEGLVLTIFLIFTEENMSDYFSTLKVGIIFSLEIVSKALLVYFQPFYDFKSNLVINLTQTASLTINFSIVLNLIIIGIAKIFSNNIIFGNLLLAPLLLKAEYQIMTAFRLNVHFLKQIDHSTIDSVWTVHRINYLKKLMKTGQNRDSLKKSNQFDLERESFLSIGATFNSEISNFNQRKVLFTELFRSLAEKTKNPLIKLLFAEYLFREFDFMIEPISLLNSILRSKRITRSLKFAALNFQNLIKESITLKSEAKRTKDIDVQHYLECVRVNEIFQNKIKSCIGYSKQFYKYFAENHPNMKNFLDNLSKKTRSNQDIQQFWEQKGQIYSREYKIMILEYGLYHSIVLLDNETGKKHVRNYILAANDTLINLEIDNICDKNIMDSNNVYIVFSGEKKDFGTIQEIKGNPHHVFGYLHDFLIGKNIEFLMPNGLASFHNNFIMARFKDPKGQLGHIVAEVFAKDNNGYIRKVHVATSLLPDIEDGIKLWGTARLSNDKASYIIANQDGYIEGITSDIGHELCINPNEKISLGKLKPNLDLVIQIMSKKNSNNDFSSYSVKAKELTCSTTTLLELNEDEIEIEISKMFDHGKIISFTPLNYSRSCEIKYHCTFAPKVYAGQKKILIKLQKLDHYPKKNLSLNKIRDFQSNGGIVNHMLKKLNLDESRAESNEVTAVLDTHFIIPDPKGNQELTLIPQSAANFLSENMLSSESDSYEKVNIRIEIHEKIKDQMNYSTSSQQSKRAQITRQRYTEAVPLLKFYKGKDIKLRFLILTIPFITVLASMIILFINSTDGISNVKSLLALYSNMHSVDIYMSSIAKTNFLLYILKVLGVYAMLYDSFLIEMTEYYTALRGVLPETLTLLNNVESSVKKMIFERDLKIFPGDYSLDSDDYHYGNLFNIIDDSIYKCSFLNSTLRLSTTTSTLAATYQNSLYANLNNDVVIKTDLIKEKLINQILENLSEMTDQSYTQIYVTSSIFGICILYFFIKVLKGNRDNKNFLDSALNGKFIEDCHSQTSSLNALQTAIDSQDFSKILKERRNTILEVKMKGKSALGSSKNKSFNDFSFKIFLVAIFSGALILIILNFLILIIAERTFFDNVNDVPALLNDIFYSGKLLKRTQVILMAFYAYSWRREMFVRNKPSETAFDEELLAFKSEVKGISQEFTYEFHMKMNENYCNFIEINPLYRNCNTSLKGINIEGLEPFLNYFALQIEDIKTSIKAYPYLHPYSKYIATSTYSTQIFESTYYYFSPAMTLLIKQTSDTILNTLDEGSTPVVNFIIIGICITILFGLYVITMLYPKIITYRRNICQILFMFPLKSILGSRALMEILINDSKDFYTLIKKCTENNEG